MSGKILLAAFFALLCLTAVAAPVDGSKKAAAVAPVDGPRTVAAAFWGAVCRGDSAAIEPMCVAKDVKNVKVKVAKILADVAEMKKASQADAAGAIVWKAFKEMKFDDVRIDGERAVINPVVTLEAGGEKSEEKLDAPLVLRRVEGKWRVDVDASKI